MAHQPTKPGADETGTVQRHCRHHPALHLELPEVRPGTGEAGLGGGGGHARGGHTSCCRRDLAKGGTVEYTNEKHTLGLAPNSTARRQLASLLEGTSDQSV